MDRKRGHGKGKKGRELAKKIRLFGFSEKGRNWWEMSRKFVTWYDWFDNV